MRIQIYSAQMGKILTETRNTKAVAPAAKQFVFPLEVCKQIVGTNPQPPSPCPPAILKHRDFIKQDYQRYNNKKSAKYDTLLRLRKVKFKTAFFINSTL